MKGQQKENLNGTVSDFYCILAQDGLRAVVFAELIVEIRHNSVEEIVRLETNADGLGKNTHIHIQCLP